MRRCYILAGAVVVCLLCGLGLQAQQSDSSASDKTNLSTSSQPAAGTVPRLIKFTGAVKDLTGKVPTGVVGLTFSLYELPEGGSPLWVETQSLTLDSLGHYTALLGANSLEGLPLDLFTSGKALWVGVQPQLPGQPEQPRVLLVAVPYSLKSSDADTLGGLPASAYLLSANANIVEGVTLPGPIPPPGSGAPPTSAAITGGGTANYAAMFTGPAMIGNSVIYNSLGGFVGIGTTLPAATLDVNGTGNFTGALRGTTATLSGALTAAGTELPATGTATATQGFASNPMDLLASSFNSGTSAAVPQLFRWNAEPAGNNTASPSGTLNLLYLSGAGTPAETGLSIASNGQITFASGQTFPGAGGGTFTGVTAGTDLTGGGTSGTVTLNLDTTKVPTLAASSNIFTGSITASSFFGDGSHLTGISAGGTITGVTAGTGLTGGGTSGNVSLAVNEGVVAFQSDLTTGINAAESYAGSAASTAQTNAVSTAEGYANSTFLPLVGGTLTGTLNLPANGLQVGTNQIVTSGGNVGIGGTPGAMNLMEINGTIAEVPYGANLMMIDGTAQSSSAAQAYSKGLVVNPTFNVTQGYANYLTTIEADPGTIVGLNVAHSVVTFHANGQPTTGHECSVAFGVNVPNQNTSLCNGTYGFYQNGNAQYNFFNSNVGIGTPFPGQMLEVVGNIKVDGTGHGLTFADGTTQTTAAVGGSGTLTGVTAGTDLTGGGTTGTVTLNLDTTKVPTLAASSNTFAGSITASSFSGVGSGLTSVNAALLGGVAASAFQPAGSYATLGANTFTGNQSVSGTVTATSLISPAFNSGSPGTALAINAANGTGNGGGLTITAGNAGSSNGGAGGNLTLTAGGAMAYGGTGYYNQGSGGSVNILAGGGFNGFGGSVLIESGGNSNWSLTSNGFTKVSLIGQNLLTSDGAEIDVEGAHNGSSSNAPLSYGGNVKITAGNGNGGLSGGNITLTPGTGTPNGAVYMGGVSGVNIGSGSSVLINASGQLGTVSSSRRYKEDIHDMGAASDGLLRLRPVTFRYKKAYDDGSKPVQYGLIAEEVNEVYPDLVVRNKDGQVETVQYYKLDAMLLNEVQKLAKAHAADQSRIAELQAQTEKLQSQVAEQQKQIAAHNQERDNERSELAQLRAELERLAAVVRTSNATVIQASAPTPSFR